MKRLLLFYLLTIITAAVTAQQSTLSGVGTNFPLGGSKTSWSTPGNVGASDNTYATIGNITGGIGNYSDYLLVSNFGFAIPAGVMIDGIVVEVERSDANARTSDFHVQLIKNSLITATDRKVAGTWPTTNGTYQAYGTPTDPWGNTWTDADINAANFGVAIAAQRTVSGSSTAGKIDHVRITVYYSAIALPLKLVDFSVQKIDNSVRLRWITADEANMDHFEVERSQTARDFASVGTIADKNLAIQNTYSFDDIRPLKNISFYRLKMISTTGAVAYSRIIPVQFSSGKGLTLYPTKWRPGMPLNIVNSNNEKLTVRFFSENGQSLGTTTTNSDLVAPDGFSNMHGWIIYRIYDEKHQLKGTGKILAE